MKKLIFSLSIVFSALIGLSQSDTLYLQKSKKIACKIYEINEYEIKYKRAEALDGPIYFVDKPTVVKYCLASGFCELLTPDELSLEHEHKDILGNRQVIKFHPFALAFNYVAFAYEKVIKVGMNLDVEAGYINSSINSSSNIFGNNNTFNSGFYIKPGLKFFLGQDFSVKGLKYAHPLKGRYIKLDLVISNINYNDLSITYQAAGTNSYNPQTGYNVYTQGQSQTVYSDLKAIAYGGFVNYGRQFILGNFLTMDYYVGIGFTGQSLSYTNPNFKINPFLNQPGVGYSYANFNESRYTTNYGTFWRIPNMGMSFTAGFRIGYIIPESKNKSKKNMPKG